VEPWLQSAIGYIRNWIEFQMRASQQPGCIVAIAHRGGIVAEYAFGHANLATDEKLTPRHRFRIASHSKSFTAAGIMKLREQRKLRLDDPVGQYVTGLHREVAATTIAQILSHSAGLTRDGADSGQFIERRPYLDEKELMGELQLPPRDRAQHAPEIFEPRIRVARTRDRSDHQGALSRLDRTRDH
jgi:CubicO group peptidase (beta-lactamase class C family)